MRKSNTFFIVCLIIFIGVFFWGLSIGTISTGISDVSDALLNYDASNENHFIIVHLRLPRLLITLLTGGALALSGYLMQAMVNNPLADPFILGTASGASLGINIASLGIFPAFLSTLFPSSIFAFVGALLVTLLAVAISNDRGHIIPSRLLLSGVALSSFMVALTTLLIYLSPSESRLKKVIFWSMGSVEQASWDKIPLLAIILFLVMIASIFFTRHLNVLLLGESRAGNLGVDVRLLRWVILCFASVLTANAVAVSGPVGFVGLMIPHLVRGIFGVHGKWNVFFAVFIGGIFLICCDLLSRITFPEADLPIGIITSFLGIPFFVYLLTNKNYRFS